MHGRFLGIILLGFVLLPGCAKHRRDIYEAADYGDAAEVSRFLALGDDPNGLDAAGYSPLVWAVQTPNNGIVIDILLRHGAKLKPSSGVSTPLTTAHPSNIVQLVNAGADVKWHLPGNGEPFGSVVMKGDAQLVRFMIAHGADPNPPGGNTYILDAAVSQKADIVEEFIKAGTSLGPDRGGPALKLAVRYSDTRMVKALLKAGADVRFHDEHGNTLIDSAIFANHRDVIIEDLIAAGADVNQPNDYGETALHFYHFTVPDAATTKVLEDHGAIDPNPADQSGGDRGHP